MFRDREITAAIEAAIKTAAEALSRAELSIEANNETGSILITYKADALPPEETLKKRLAALAASFPRIERLRVRAAFYRPDEDRELMLEALQRLKEALPELLAP